ncbi:hypothetical protein ANAEL_00186 [Anaerolineales bacterium]|nr:hypothetical protein ANAEL_00186 [Anaerolineales bacterium]
MQTFRCYLQQCLEFWGRRQSPKIYSFPENEVMTPENFFYVWPLVGAKYLNLHPTLYAVAISPDGRPQILKGGYNFPLPTGRYIIHYIDKRDRIGVTPKTSEITQDGANVSLELIITYRISDPIKVLEIERPVDTFFSLIQADLREFIRNHRYDEIFGIGDGQSIDSAKISQYIRQQHIDRRQVSRVFTITNVAVEEREGDSKLTEIRKDFQVQHKQNIAATELTKQNQELERKVTSQDAEIKRMKAQADVTQQEILQKMQLQKIELENARNELTWRQDKWARAMDAIAQTLSIPNYQRDQGEIDVIHEILDELKAQAGRGSGSAPGDSQPASGNTKNKKEGEKLDTLTDTLLSLLDRKRKL